MIDDTVFASHDVAARMNRFAHEQLSLADLDRVARDWKCRDYADFVATKLGKLELNGGVAV